MAGTGEGKKEEADYKRLHSFPLIRVRRWRDGASGPPEHHSSSTFQWDYVFNQQFHLFFCVCSKTLASPCWCLSFKATISFKIAGLMCQMLIMQEICKKYLLWQSIVINRHIFKMFVLFFMIAVTLLCVLSIQTCQRKWGWRPWSFVLLPVRSLLQTMK